MALASHAPPLTKVRRGAESGGPCPVSAELSRQPIDAGETASRVENNAKEPRIGPNAVLRVADALRAKSADQEGADSAPGDLTQIVFKAAGLERHLTTPPSDMVPEGDVVQLQAALHGRLGHGLADAINRDAGARTADYLLGYRIPRAAQTLMRILPAPLAAHLLMSSIGQHAWTFAGSGAFSWWRHKSGIAFQIVNCPYCRGLACEAHRGCNNRRDAPREVMQPAACSYVAATFESLFRAVVQHSTVVEETACEAFGASACRFEISWRRSPPRLHRSG